jgi:hypothetical protein
MNEFNVTQETQSQPVGMKIVGTGVILSCLVLSALFAWGIYLDLTAVPEPCVCEEVECEEAGPGDPEGGISKGVFIRTAAPAFTLNVPSGMKERPKGPGDLYAGGQDMSPFSLGIRLDDYEEGTPFEAWAKGSADGWKTTFENVLKSPKVEIAGIKKIDMYGDYPAMEMKIKWMWTDATTQLTNYNHLILKGDKVITLSCTLIGDPEQAYAMYRTINLDP